MGPELASPFAGTSAPVRIVTTPGSSSAGKIGSLAEELLLYCYQYDPTSGRYGPVVMNLVRLGGVVTVGLVAAFVIVMRRRETRSAERRA